MFEKYKVRKTLLGAKEISEIFACDREIAKQVIAQIKTVSRIEKSKTKVDVRDYLHFTMNMSPNQMRAVTSQFSSKKALEEVPFTLDGTMLGQALYN